MAKVKKEDKILMTQEGLSELEEELRELKEKKRPKAVDRLQAARDMGDLTENGEYSSARQDLEFIDERIVEFEEKLRNVEVVAKSKKGKTVGIGSTITLKTGNSKVVYAVVGEGEADPAENKISHNSPIGKAVMGKKAWDEVKVNAPAGIIKYTIKKIE